MATPARATQAMTRTRKELEQHIDWCESEISIYESEVEEIDVVIDDLYVQMSEAEDELQELKEAAQAE